MVLRLIDLEGNHYPAEASTGIDEELNSDSMLSISFQSTRTNDQFISDLSELWRISGVKGSGDETEYVINFLTRKGKGNKMVAHIRAIPKMFDDLAKDREYERFDQSFTAHNFFTLVFKDTPYTFVLLDSFGALRFEGLGEGDQKIEMFLHGINRYGIEFEIVGNEVRMRKRIERDMPYQLRWRLNASNIQEEIDATGFVTYAKGYGDYGDGEGGEDWRDAKLIREYTSPLAQIPGIGIRHAQPIKNGNITDENTMDDNLKALVDESLKISVTADFHRLKNYPYAEPQKGDLIHLIDERINFKRKVRVIKVITYRDSKGNITKQDVTFGDVGIAKRHQAKTNSTMNTVDRIMEGRQKIPFSVLDDAVLAATKALQNAQTELVFPESGGIQAIDKTNPNKMVVYNSAGLGISDDGGQTFKTAITGDGIVADVITAGVLRGIDIIGTNIMSFNAATNDVITLENGKIETFQGGDKTFEINSRGLTAFSWREGEVGTFRNSVLSGDNSKVGLDIMGWADYLSIGKQETGSISNTQLGFYWYGDYDDAVLTGAAEGRDGNVRILSRRGGGVPNMVIDHRTDGGTIWAGARVFVGRDNLNPNVANFRSGFEVWQYEGKGDGSLHRMFHIDTNTSGEKFADFWIDKLWVEGIISSNHSMRLAGSGAAGVDNGIQIRSGSTGTEHVITGHTTNWGFNIYPQRWSGADRFRIRSHNEKADYVDDLIINNDGVLLIRQEAKMQTLTLTNGVPGDTETNDRAAIFYEDTNFKIVTKNSSGDWWKRIEIEGRGSSGSVNNTTHLWDKIRSEGTRYNTVTWAGRVAMGADTSIMGFVSSSRRYKLMIKSVEDVGVDPYKIHLLNPKSWYDKFNTEKYADLLTRKSNGEKVDFDVEKIRRIGGLIAEDVHAAGLSLYVNYNSDGEVEGIDDDRLWTLLIPISRDHEVRLNEYDDRFGTIENRLENLENEINKLKGVA